MGSSATRLGDVLNDAYELQELVSASGPHEVYRATDRRTRSAVRVKLLRPEFALQSAVVEGFLRAPRSLSQVAHPSLPLVRVDTDDTGIPFVVEEAIEGRTLSGLIASFPQGLPLAMIKQVYVPLVEALALAHEHGMVHGRIDEDRVTLLGATHAPLPKLLGLGAANEDCGQQDASYRAPELIVGRPTRQTDVFALGVLLYKMLSGELPFRSGKKSAVPLDEIAPHLPKPWVELTRACLEPQSGKRMADAGAVLAALRACTQPSAAPKKSHKPQPVAKAVVATTTVADTPDIAATQLAPSCPPATVAASMRTIDAVADAFGGLADEVEAAEKADAERKSRADAKRATDKKDVVAKLGAKTRPKPDTQVKDARAAVSSRAPRTRTSQPTRPKAAPASSRPGQPAPGTPKRPAGATQVALTEAQLNALRALRDDDDDRDRWVGVFFLLLFLVLFQLAVPMLYEPNMATAQANFGPKLRVVVTGFSVVAVIGALRMWAAKQQSLISRVTSLLLVAVTGCIVVLTATLYSHSAGVAMLAGPARHALPWGTGGFFFFFGLGFGLRGLRELGSSVSYGMLALALACGSLYSSYHAISATIIKDKQQRAARPVKERAKDTPHTFPTSFDDIKKRLTNAASQAKSQGQDVNTVEQRKEVGADEAEDLKSLQELERARSKNQQDLRDLSKTAQAPADEQPP